MSPCAQMHSANSASEANLNDERKGKQTMMLRGSRVLLIGWCLISVWLLYAGLELAEELTILEKAQSSEQDLDLEALLQIGSGLKSDIPALHTPVTLLTTISAPECSLFHAMPMPQEHDDPLEQRGPSLRLHQFLSVYRI